MSSSELLFFPMKLREQIYAALDKPTAAEYAEPTPQTLYFPVGHDKALNPDNALVIGMRGAGKTFWWKALQNNALRSVIPRHYPRAGVLENAIVTPGFGANPNVCYPDPDTLTALIREDEDASPIWRTVIFWNVVNKDDLPDIASWNDRRNWVKSNTQKVSELLLAKDKELDDKNQFHIVLFDALDVASREWATVFKLVKGLLENLLRFSTYKRIRPKAFLRNDHLEDSSVQGFPDSSKLLNRSIELEWPREELYNMFWSYLWNDTATPNTFQTQLCESFNIRLPNDQRTGMIPSELKTEENQKRVFNAIAGEFMGTNRRRGFTYSWLYGHLCDSSGNVSPRSFIEALKTAAEGLTRQDSKHPLHYEDIKKGVQAASKIRVDELAEDYPWVRTLLEPLKNMNVPASFEDISDKWKRKFPRGYDELASAKLAPQHLREGERGLYEDLINLHIFEEMKDGRTNLPDVYRVAFVIGRKGGVKTLSGKGR
jgi:hypothetical protein